MTRNFVVRLMVALLLLIILPGARGQYYSFHAYGANEGLDSLTVNCLLQDHTGFLWAGTENGLYRFDGYRYLRIGADRGLQGTYITSLHEDAGGELWVGTTTGLFHGDGSHFSAITATFPVRMMAPGQQLSSLGSGQALAVNRRHLLRLSRNGPNGPWNIASFFSAQVLALHPDLNAINSIFVARNGDLWMGCGDAICSVKGSNGIQVFGPAQGVTADRWVWFLEDSSGRLWARGSRHLRVWNPQHGGLFSDMGMPAVHDTYSTPFLPIVEDAKHRILTYTVQGLAIWEKGTWRTVSAANGLKVPGIHALLIDRSGGLWLGTYGKGVQRWVGYGNWETWSAGQTEENPLVWSMIRDHRGTLWAATESGIVRFSSRQARFVAWHPSTGLPRHQVDSVVEARDRSLWFSESQDLLLRYEPDTGHTQQWSFANAKVRRMYADSSGRVWILTGGSILTYDPAARAIRRAEDPAIPSQLFFDACEDRSHGMWFVSGDGLLHFSNGRWSRIATSGVDAPEDGFASVACSTDGTLWLGGDPSGVTPSVVHVRVSGDVAALANPQPPAEVRSAEVMFVRHDHRGWLWIGTGSGVYGFNGDTWRHLTEKDGLAWNDTDEGAFLEDSDGSIWIGTANGLAHLLHPTEVFVEPPLQIIELQATLGDTPILPGTSLSFAWTREPLQVHMASSAIQDSSSVVYRYRLTGVDRKWMTTPSPDLRYASLPDGTYHLEAMAEDTAQSMRSPVVTVSFRIRPPWWKSVWFESATGLFLIALTWMLLRAREQGMVARQMKLKSLVRERTHQLELEKEQLTLARESLREQAIRDPLTGLLNHGAIRDALCREIDRSQREGRTFTILLIDIDHFKQVNDKYGHLAGDDVLRELARRLTGSIRTYDAVGRYGGEEFLLIMPDVDSSRERDRIEALHAAVCSNPMQIRDAQLSVTCSFGVSMYLGLASMTPEQILDRADQALYRAKAKGRNRVEMDTSEAIVSLER
ncbi:MAG: diguanylate cyclase [Terriglobales bacterium]